MTNDSNAFTENMHILNFTIIATDGALFRTPIHNISQFSLAAAERLELLVKFDKIPVAISNVYVVCYDADATLPFVVKYVFRVSKVPVANKYQNPTEYLTFDTPFISLQNMPNSTIAQYRMRALFSRPI
jgi:FtsP/CotA-like multicopper oxidase with cupredoxin domain